MSRRLPHQIGKEAFEAYYQTFFFDSQTFQQFLNTLRTPSQPILRFHPKNESALRALWGAHGFTWKTLSWYAYALLWPSEAEPDTILPGYTDHLFYPMNASSLIPVLALDVQPDADQHILDACAAPGGKTVCIAERAGKNATIIANDTSPQRRNRLRTLLEEYHAPEVRVIGKKAETLFLQYPHAFDRILADVPCSSEKHVYNSPAHLVQWSPARIRQLKQRQLAIVSGLFEALKPGGKLVYSTCAITPEENEEVIAQLLKKKKQRIRLCEWTLSCPGSSGWSTSKTEQVNLSSVRRILPHVNEYGEQYDPMFVAILECVE